MNLVYLWDRYLWLRVWMEVRLRVCLHKQRLLPLFLVVKDVNCLPKLC
jgi:hypothetical protein